MRHNIGGRTLHRKSNHRRALFANLAIALFTHGEITTTRPKAKAAQPFIERLITEAKKGDVAARRRVVAALGWDKPMVKNDMDPAAVRNAYGELKEAPKVSKHLFDVLAPRFKDRKGGCTRIIKVADRRWGDGTELCVLQLVGAEDKRSKPSGSSPRAAKANKRTAFAAAAKAKTAPQA